MAICKVPISDLPVSHSLDGSELIPVVEGTFTKQSALSELSGFVNLQYVTDSNNTTTTGLSTNATIVTNVLSATEIHALSSFTKILDIKQFELSGFTVTGNVSVSGDINASEGLKIDSDTLFVQGGSNKVGINTSNPISGLHINSGGLKVEDRSKFDDKVTITPYAGQALFVSSRSPDNPAAPINVEGPATITHDVFKQSGVTGGFADNSNHFHTLTEINLIEQLSADDYKNLEKVQERYYAIDKNLLPNDKAAFLARHRVARSIDTTVVDTSTATLNVSALQNSSNRKANTEAFFVNNTSPAGKSEPLIITLAGHTFNSNDQVRMKFTQAFQGPIVAADLFGQVTNTTTNNLSVQLFGGNYKTTTQVPLGTSLSALSFEEVVLETVGTSTIVNQGNEQYLQLYDKSNFVPSRTKNETLSAKWSTAHGLVKNEHITLITDGRDDLVIQEDAYVLDPAPGGDNTSIILVYGRRIKQYDITSLNSFGSSNWTVHKGTFDGIHFDVLGDNLINFNANNKGEYTAYQIGPGTQTDANAIAIGTNVYNKDAETIKLGYGNNMLDITTTGVKISGTSEQQGDFAVNGDTLFVDTADDRVGIGLTNPSTSLHIKDNIPEFRLEDEDTGARAGIQASDGNLEFYADDGDTAATSSTIVFQLDNTERVRIDKDGNVGIGATSPSKPLHMCVPVPEIRLQDSDTNNYAGVQASNGNLEFFADDGSGASNSNIVFQIDNNEVVKFDCTGKVGIGTSNPNKALTVIGDISGTSRAIIGGCNIATGDSSSVIGGQGHLADGNRSFIGGGFNNISSGSRSIVGGGCTNITTADDASVIGGKENKANGVRSSVIGGLSGTTSCNDSVIIGGKVGESNADRSVVIGGQCNKAEKNDSFIGGGNTLSAAGPRSALIGGQNNITSNDDSVIIGGEKNLAKGNNSVVIGGNTLSACNSDSVIVGGQGNEVTSLRSASIGGQNNTVGGEYSHIGGGFTNVASGCRSTIVGGQCNTSSGTRSFIGGGQCNSSCGDESTVVGGCTNVASGNESTVTGGNCNTANGEQATIVGGFNNSASAQRTNIIGGHTNVASTIDANIIGGFKSTASGTRSTVIGGYTLSATNESTFAAGGLCNIASGCRSATIGGVNNTASGERTFIGGGCNNTANATDTFILGSNITASVQNTTFVNNLSTTDDLNVSGVTEVESLTAKGDLTVDTNTLFVDSSTDRVGIGTLAPNKALTVIGDISATGRLTVPTLETDIEASELVVTSGLSADGNTFTVDATNNKVGIGTNAPNKPLTVIGDISGSNSLFISNSASVGDSKIILYGSTGNICNDGQINSGGDICTGADLRGSGALIGSNILHAETTTGTVGIGTGALADIQLTVAGGISASGGLSATNVYAIDKIGIGTNTPSETLTVVGNISAQGSTFTSGSANIDGAINFGHRTSNDTLIVGQASGHDLTLLRGEANTGAVGVDVKYLGSGNSDENIFEIATDGGGSFKMDQSGDVGLNTAPIDGVDLTVASTCITTGLTSNDISLISTTGDRIIKVNNSSTGDGGDLNLKAASSLGGDGHGGDVCILAGGGHVNGQNGHIIIESGAGASEPAGDLEFKVGSTQALNLTFTESVFNEGSADLDLRVESNNNTSMLHVDAANDKVGIGTATPNEALTVVGSISGNNKIIGGQGSIATGNLTHIGGGINNTAGADYSHIGGGNCNITVAGHSYSTIGGGLENKTLSAYSAVVGGACNTADAQFASVVGGLSNTAASAYTFIGGGASNTVSSNRSGIMGGMCNIIDIAHQDSFIIGSCITSNASCTTFVNNLSSQGSLHAGDGFSGNVAGCSTITVVNGIITAAS